MKLRILPITYELAVGFIISIALSSSLISSYVESKQFSEIIWIVGFTIISVGLLVYTTLDSVKKMLVDDTRKERKKKRYILVEEV